MSENKKQHSNHVQQYVHTAAEKPLTSSVISPSTVPTLQSAAMRAVRPAAAPCFSAAWSSARQRAESSSALALTMATCALPLWDDRKR